MENELYSNTKYSFERNESKTIVINVPMTTSDNTFDVSLPEILTIDKHSNIYLDSLTTFYCKTSRDPDNAITGDNMGFILSIDQFEMKSVSNTSGIGRSIFIPNDQNINTAATNASVQDLAISKTHKGKKLNYICSINPTNINRISGKLTNINGGTVFAGNGRFIAEFVITSK
tara:strand:- start:56 stop:574 length:519 start_codon:yes stop_codon:yes gene_type:complete